MGDAHGLQLIAVGLLGVFLLWFYSPFYGALYRFLTTYLGLTLLLVLIFALVYGLLGPGFGIPYLFWHEKFAGRVGASLGVTLVLGVVGVIAFYLDPHPWETARKTANWLAADEALKARIDIFWHRGLRVDPPSQAARPVRWSDYLIFFANVVLDPLSISPFQNWVEPTRPNQRLLQRFLRTCRTPFLLSLLAPALFPAVFSWVPKLAPTSGPPRDVRHDLFGYAMAVAAWLLGIVIGVFVIKVFIRLSELFYALIPQEGEIAAADEGGRILADPVCPRRSSGECPADGCPRQAIRVDPEVPWRRRAILWLRLVILLLVVLFWLICRFSSAAPLFARTVAPGFAFLIAIGIVALAFVGRPRHQVLPERDPPRRCRANRLRRISIGVFVGLFLLTYIVMGAVRPLYDLPWSGYPAFAICAALGIFAMVFAVIEFLPRPVRFPIVVVLVLWLAYANNDPFKDRFENMDYTAAGQVDLRPRVDKVYFESALTADGKVDHGPLILDAEALANWAANPALQASAGQPKLVIVSVSGGATRSAYWTAVVLDRLEREIPGFGHHVRIITGASGGMLGTAYYVTYRRAVAEGRAVEPHQAPTPTGRATPTDWAEAFPKESIQPLARFIALKEIWRSLCPYPLKIDRGVILERDWRDLRYPFSQLAGLERAGRIPSLIFSPMMIEDGRQLLISNLDLGLDREGSRLPTIMTQGRQVSFSNDATQLQDVSLPAIEFFRIFPKVHDRFYVSTAVRMNASFPYVSPAVNLPTIPPRRVVDAGYYDNYGIQLAAAWIRQNHADLARLTSGVLLVQIRDSASERDRLDVADEPATAWEVATRGFQFLTSPIEGLMEARYTVSSFRNDADVESLNAPFSSNQEGSVPDSHGFYTTISFENSADVTIEVTDFWTELTCLESNGCPGDSHKDGRPVSMTWYLTRAEQAATRTAIPPDPGPRSPWQDPGRRATMRRKLSEQAFETMKPGPERDLRFKYLEKLRNYEQFRLLKDWWRTEFHANQ